MQEKGLKLNRDTPLDIVVLGAGFIGQSFAAVFLDAGWHVTLCDPDQHRLEQARAGLLAQQDAISLAGLAKGNCGRIELTASLADAAGRAAMVIECGPENVATKQSIFADLLKTAGQTTVLATASSAIPISRIVPSPDQQTRCLVAHPVNPPAVLRIIELCPAPSTAPATVNRAAEIFGAAGFETAVLGHEVEGFLLNRLQGAVLREGYRLVEEGVATPDDIDKVMRMGLGPRWALSGPFETAELNTPGGIPAHAARMGPAYKRIGESRGETVNWSEELVGRVAASRDRARGDTSIEERARWRSRAVAKLVAFRDRLAGESDA
jgi:3-hydroxyacyl-CoA dehydrogenase